MNCLACHQGKVAGRVIPGLPNSLFDLESLTEDTRAVKQRRGVSLTRMDLGLPRCRWARPGARATR